jgi:dipeptidyl aminopeptidase/acylaminoacyl peptidase
VDQARFDGRHIVQFPYKGNGQGYLANPRQARRYNPTQVFTQKFDGSARTQLTHTAYSHRDVQVSPDGKWIAFIADAKLRGDSIVQAEADSLALLPFDKVRDAAPRNDNEIFVMPVAGGEPRKLATIQGDESQLEWSPDSKSLAFISRPTRTANAVLLVADATSGATRNMTPKWQYEPANAYWLANGNILMVAQIGGRGAFFSVDVKAGAFREIVGGRRVIRGGSMDDARAQMAFIASSVTKPTELFVMNADGSGERKLTDFNGTLNAEIGWADAERFTYKSVGNLEIEGWLMKPFGYQAGRKYPVVLYIHGGPHSQYDEGWFDEFQNLAGAGMMVLYTNPRGSSGYGADFTYITRGKWGGDDYLDLMGHHQDEPVQGGAGRSHDRELGELVQRQRRAGPHRVRVLRQAVGESGDVRHALADQVRREGQDADVHGPERGGLPDAHARGRPVVHVAQEARRAGRVGAVSPVHPRPLAHG